MSDPDRGEIHQAARDVSGKFLPGASGNRKGRPVGAGWAPDLRRALRADATAVMHQLAQRAREGDMKAAELLLSRVLPPMKPGDDALKLPAPSGTLAQQVLMQIGLGAVSPATGAELLAGLASAVRIQEAGEFEQRLQRLESTQAARQPGAS